MLENYEDFTQEQMQILDKYVTNTKQSIFVLKNLPEVIKGALFSRYSRSTLGLRSLLLKEFIQNSDETYFDAISGANQNSDEQLLAIQKAQSFYDRILDGYGDDSIGELGGAHIAIENISMLAAKAIEDARIGGSPLEKSTRYVYFDQKVRGEYLFYRDPILMTSAFKNLYLDTCNMLFDTYAKLITPMTAFMEERFAKAPETSKAAYAAAIRAKALDCLRGLLPASTLTNMGIFGNGRFYENLLHRLSSNNLFEMQEIAKLAGDELHKVIPSFVRRANSEHKTHQQYAQYVENMEMELKSLAQAHEPFDDFKEPGVRLISYDSESIYKVCAALLFPHSKKGLAELISYCKNLPEEELMRILDGAAAFRENRRNKSPRALENAVFTFEIIADYGSYRDMHRHRMLTQERQNLSCSFGFYTPQEVEESNLGAQYRQAMEKAKEVYDFIAQEFPEEAQYIVPMAYNIRWYFTINLRSLQWMCELRSTPQGHPSYRQMAQQMAKEVFEAMPLYERFFKFMDFEGYELGRLGQEQRKAEKLGLE